MINVNDFHAVLPDQDLKAMDTHLDQMVKTLSFKVQLTPEERSKVSSVSDKRLAFVIKADDYARQFPDAIAPFMKIAKTQDNFDTFLKLLSLARKLTSLLEMITDTSIVASAQVFGILTKFYANLKMASDSGMPGGDDAIQDLSVLFRKATGGISIEDFDSDEELNVELSDASVKDDSESSDSKDA